MIRQHKKMILLTSIATLLPILIGLLLWKQLPDSVATHWSTGNEPDGYSSKAFAVFGLPVIMLILHLVCVIAQVVHELYTYRDEVLLVLTKAQGSSMERMPDRLVDQMDEHNAFICEAMCKAYHVPMVEQSVVHWMSHSQIDMFIFMVTHIDDEEEALRFAEKGVKYLLAGWYGLVRP